MSKHPGKSRTLYSQSEVLPLESVHVPKFNFCIISRFYLKLKLLNILNHQFNQFYRKSICQVK